jgi:hypothetical protein
MMAIVSFSLVVYSIRLSFVFSVILAGRYGYLVTSLGDFSRPLHSRFTSCWNDQPCPFLAQSDLAETTAPLQ